MAGKLLRANGYWVHNIGPVRPRVGPVRRSKHGSDPNFRG